MNLKTKLSKLGLDADNSVVIGSGVMSALGIRESGDIDVETEDFECVCVSENCVAKK